MQKRATVNWWLYLNELRFISVTDEENLKIAFLSKEPINHSITFSENKCPKAKRTPLKSIPFGYRVRRAVCTIHIYKYISTRIYASQSINLLEKWMSKSFHLVSFLVSCCCIYCWCVLSLIRMKCERVRMDAYLLLILRVNILSHSWSWIYVEWLCSYTHSLYLVHSFLAFSILYICILCSSAHTTYDTATICIYAISRAWCK